MYEKLIKSIVEFGSKLDSKQEIGARLVNFGPETIQIEDVGFWGHQMVKFYGRNSKGCPVELIQHYSQVNVLLMAISVKSDRKARRIGFELTKKLDDS
jgi:hypothetical protein